MLGARRQLLDEKPRQRLLSLRHNIRPTAHHGLHLGFEIGVVLGGGPDGEDQMVGVDRVQPAFGDPARDDGGLLVEIQPKKE